MPESERIGQVEEQFPRPPQQPPDTFGYPAPRYDGPPPGAYPAGPQQPGYSPYPGAPVGYPPNPYAPPPMPKSSGFPWWGWLLGGCLGIVAIGVIGCVILGGVLGARLGGVISRIANEQYVSETSTQSFTVTGTPTIVVSNAGGNVSFQVGTSDIVTVEITKRAGDSTTSAAQSDLQDITATATQAGGTITIQTGLGRTEDLGQTFSVDLMITGPAAATLTIGDQDGDLSLTGVQGVVTTNVQVGDVELVNVTLASGSHVQTNLGDIALDGQLAPGASVEFTTDVGNVDVTMPGASTNTYLNARTNVGDITITGWSVTPTSGGAAGGSASGNLGATPSGTLTIHVNTGDISVTAA